MQDLSITLGSKTQKEALINELKGNLFEYLVASFLSRKYGIEKEFMSSFDGGIKSQLSKYEMWLRENDKDLIFQLPILAQKTAFEITECLPKEINSIFVIGKITGSSQKSFWNEADILCLSGEKEYPISLKLCKANAYVNTKSGGVKSFIEKYFSSLDKSVLWQDCLNKAVDKSFSKMAFKVHELAGIEFSGKFEKSWTELGLSELPGKLPKDMNAIVVNSYHEIVKVIHEAFIDMNFSNKDEFLKSLFPIIGMGHPEIIQVTCFHGVNTINGLKKRYQLKDIIVSGSKKILNNLQLTEIMPLKDGLSSFEVKFKQFTLQIRVKPMNKFTAPSFKINCSVK